jgi:hypothetical protein
MTAYDKSGTITSGAAGASRLVDGNLFGDHDSGAGKVDELLLVGANDFEVARGGERLFGVFDAVEPERDVESGELAARRFDACDWTYLRT